MLLTPRESQITGLVAQGASNKRIAEQLSISEHTVKAHLTTIFRKIAVSNRLELALHIKASTQDLKI